MLSFHESVEMKYMHLHSLFEQWIFIFVSYYGNTSNGAVYISRDNMQLCYKSCINLGNNKS